MIATQTEKMGDIKIKRKIVRKKLETADDAINNENGTEETGEKADENIGSSEDENIKSADADDCDGARYRDI